MGRISDSTEAARAFLEAEDIAAHVEQDLASTHVLLAMFTFVNRAKVVLEERSITEDILLRAIRSAEVEHPRLVGLLRERGRMIAQSAQSHEVDCLHVLIAITNMRETLAFQLLERVGISPSTLRNLAMGYVTGTMPRRVREIQQISRLSALSKATNAASMAAITSKAPPSPLSVRLKYDSNMQHVAESHMPQNAVASSSVLPAVSTPQSTRPRLADLAPSLARCGIDLVDIARTQCPERPNFDPAVGRTHELQTLIDILGKRRANNPMLVGPAGVGKTAIVEGLALKIARNDSDVAALHDHVICALDTGSLVAGTSLRGAFSERLAAIKDEVAAAHGRIVVFIDELHTLIGSGAGGDTSHDGAHELKTALARGEFPCIGATTHDEYKKYIERDPALERRFTPIQIDEPTPEAALRIVEDSIAPYAAHHDIKYSAEATHAAVHLSHRFVMERHLPDKAFAALDLAGSRAHRRQQLQVTRRDIAQVIHEWTDVPLDHLIVDDAERLRHAEAIVAQHFVGQTHGVRAVCDALRRSLAGFRKHRPIGSFLFLGPTGVGKTELVKVLAELLFGKRDAIVRLDMSELTEHHAIARLLGAQPGYVGYEDGGQLTEAIRRRPFQIVLFDEIDKAHPDILNVLLQILDEGKLTDAKGRCVSFANTVVILTSNVGADVASQPRSGFTAHTTDEASASERISLAASQHFTPELWGRLDERLVFLPLLSADISRIAALQLQQSADALQQERGIRLTWDENVTDYLLQHGGYDRKTGARGMRQAIQQYIEAPIAQTLLQHALQWERGDALHVGIDEGALVITPEHGVTSTIAPCDELVS